MVSVTVLTATRNVPQFKDGRYSNHSGGESHRVQKGPTVEGFHPLIFIKSQVWIIVVAVQKAYHNSASHHITSERSTIPDSGPLQFSALMADGTRTRSRCSPSHRGFGGRNRILSNSVNSANSFVRQRVSLVTGRRLVHGNSEAALGDCRSTLRIISKSSWLQSPLPDVENTAMRTNRQFAFAWILWGRSLVMPTRT